MFLIPQLDFWRIGSYNTQTFKRCERNLCMGRTKELIGNGLGQDPHSNGERPNNFVVKESLFDPRKERIDWWRNAPEKVIEYEGNNAIDKDGNTYWYGQGTRLLIGDPEKGEAIQVMDSCETPWAFATVDMAFKELVSKSGQVDVLERGFGMGITSRKVIQNLVPRGGSYTVIELNKINATYAKREWRPKQISAFANMASGMPGTKPIIAIDIIDGEAYEETAKLLEAERKFDIIISDTFPLTEDEQGMNDLQDLDVLKRCLKTGGVFAFFAYYSGSAGALELVRKQGEMIDRHFGDYGVSPARINPPPEYKYLHTDTGDPVRTLPVVVCKNPIL